MSNIIKKYLEHLYHKGDHGNNDHKRVRHHDIKTIGKLIATSKGDDEPHKKLNRRPYKFSKYHAKNVNGIEKAKERYNKYKNVDKSKVG